MKVRFSIGLLLAFIALCGLGLAALRSPSHLWASTLFAVALGSLPVAVLNAIYARERRRAFWTGFLVIGGSYFVATQGPWFRDEFGPRLVTTAVLDLGYVQVAPAPAAPNAAVGTLLAQVSPNGNNAYNELVQQLLALSGPQPRSQWSAWTEPDRTGGVGLQVGGLTVASPETFRRIGHSLLTLVLAALGGLYAGRRHDAGARVAS
jgi:hypothetical protein